MIDFVQVQYVADASIADPLALADIVKRDVEAHIASIDDLPIRNGDLQIQIERFELTGKVKMLIAGTINDRSLDGTILHVNNRPQMFIRKKHASHYAAKIRQHQREQRNGPAVLFFWFLSELCKGPWRWLFPSAVTRAIGRSCFVGLVQRSFSDCLEEIHIRIDEAIERPESGGAAQLSFSGGLAVVTAVIGVVLAIGWFFVHDRTGSDPVPGCFGMLFLSFGIAGAIFGWNLLTIPQRFWNSNRTGHRLMKRFGFRSPRTLRTFAAVLLVGSLLFSVLGVFLFSQ